MNREDILLVIKDIVCNKVKLTNDAEKINENTDLLNDFSIDSMQLTTFIVELEDQLGVEIVSEDLNAAIITKIDHLITYILERNDI